MEAQWPRFVEAIGKPELLHDERFADLKGRMKNRDDLNNIIHDWMQSFENDQEILDILAEARVPSGPVLAPYDAIGHPYFDRAELFEKLLIHFSETCIFPVIRSGSLTFLNR